MTQVLLFSISAQVC